MSPSRNNCDNMRPPEPAQLPVISGYCAPCRFGFEPHWPPIVKVPKIQGFGGEQKKRDKNVRQLGLSENVPDVKLFTASGDLKKRWFVWYYLKEGERKKRIRLYGQVNYCKDKDLRFKMLQVLQKRIQEGFSRGLQLTDSRPVPFTDPHSLSLQEWIDKVLKEKKLYQKKTSYRATESHLKHFKEWLKEQGILTAPPTVITKAHIAGFRNWLLSRPVSKGSGPVSNRTANNYLIDIDGVFNHLKENYEDIIKKNPCQGIRPLPTESEKHTVYTFDQVEKISEWMRRNDPQLHFFCRFLVYCFMRPNEILNIKYKYIHWDKGEIHMPPGTIKTRKTKVKYIMEVFLNDLKKMDLQDRTQNAYLFESRRKPGSPLIGAAFIKRFRKVKRVFGLSRNHTMYGLRHTFVSQLLRNGVDRMQLMKWTGHESIASFEKYIREYMLEAPADISHKYTQVF